MKEVYFNFIDTSVKSFKLLETGDPFPLNLMFASGVGEELNKILPDSTVRSLLNNSKTDSSTHFWSPEMFPKAIFITKAQADTLSGEVLVVKYPEESKAKFKQRKKELERKRGSFYYFSKPIFDFSQKYALVSASDICGSGCGTGCVYLFEQNNGRWKLLLKLSCWIK
jgi:hypothetical protein